MSLFQEYETIRKHFKIGAKWICKDSKAVLADLNEVVEIVKIYNSRQVVEIKVLTGSFANGEYSYTFNKFRKGYTPQ